MLFGFILVRGVLPLWRNAIYVLYSPRYQDWSVTDLVLSYLTTKDTFFFIHIENIRVNLGCSRKSVYWRNVAMKVSLLLCLERTAGGISLHVNADKIECMCFNQKGDISTVNGRSLKLVDKFTYLGNSVASTENVISMWLAKACTTIDRLSVIWKSGL